MVPKIKDFWQKYTDGVLASNIVVRLLTSDIEIHNPCMCMYMQWAQVKLCIVHCVWYYVQLQPNSLHTQSLYIHIQGLCIFISEVSKRTNTYVCTYVLSSRNFCKTMVKVVKMNCWAIRLRVEISKYYIVTP